jgi:hypothetical protein
MDLAKLYEIGQKAERMRDQGRPIDLSVLVGLAAELGPVSWRDAAELAVQDRKSEAGRPLYLLTFIAALASSLRPASLLDPWVTAPTVLAAAHEATASTHSCGLVWNEQMWEVAQRIAPVDWRLGQPMHLLRELADERFDLVLAAPPVNMRLPTDREPDDPAGRVSTEDLVFWRAARLISDGGHVLFHTADSFFWAEARRRLWPQLAQQGLHPQAVVSVDRGFGPATSLESSLVLFGAEAQEQLVVGRLDRDTSVDALVENVIARRQADDPHLGALTPAESFRGWRRFVVEREIAAMFESSDVRPLAMIGNVRRVQLKPAMSYDPAPNCVFVPTLGFGNVLTVPPDLEGKKSYTLVEVQLDPRSRVQSTSRGSSRVRPASSCVKRSRADQRSRA